ncbi:hypothetical protein PF011_g27304 [Phytophthora fragariae]|uniref:Uncharacterized protein n=1 Tax=Phytophthora fragariae TaxID=53985 RepID=A0A6A3HHA1_9STRA|nr:hypothetical protein PF011_g27304 [Phytophthora fragariae]
MFCCDCDGFGWGLPFVDAENCKGTASSSGLRCHRNWGLNSHGYCRYHKSQDPDAKSAKAHWGYEPYSPRSRCRGIAASGKRCDKDWELYPNGYCEVHQNQAPM